LEIECLNLLGVAPQRASREDEWPPVRAARLQRAGIGFRRAAKTARRRSGILPSRSTEQRLALDAVLCGGLIRVKGARLRIRHRLAPLPLAAPRDAAFAAPPASPSPKCGIESIPAAGGRIVRLIEPSVPAGVKASCQLHPRHPCRGAVAALEVNASRDGSKRRRLSRAPVFRQVSAPAAAALRCPSSASLAACRVRSVAAMDALEPRRHRPASLRSGRGRPREGILPSLWRRHRAAAQSRRAQWPRNRFGGS